MTIGKSAAPRNFVAPERGLMLRAGRNQRLGFTLVELLLVVGLITVLFGLAIPSLQSFASQSRSQTLLHRVRTSCLATRQRAIDEGKSIRWQGDHASYKEGDRDNGIRVRLTANEPLVFHPNGTAVDAKITVSDEIGVLGCFYIRGATGAIVLEASP